MRDSAGNEDRSKVFLTDDDIKALWEERLVSLQCLTGNGEGLIPQLADGVPGWFKAQELGLALDQSPSILSTVYGCPQHDVPSLREANASRKHLERDLENSLIKALLAATPSKVVRARVKLIPPARGCSGCSSCVPDTRLRPTRGRDRARLASWTPGSMRPVDAAVVSFLRAAAVAVRRARREDRAVISFLRAGAAAIRRARSDGQSATKRQRKDRHNGARAQMQARRDETKAMRAVARRVGVRVKNGSVTREGSS